MTTEYYQYQKQMLDANLSVIHNLSESRKSKKLSEWQKMEKSALILAIAQKNVERVSVVMRGAREMIIK